MILAKHYIPTGSRWALDGYFLPSDWTLATLLEMPRAEMLELLAGFSKTRPVFGEAAAPLDPQQEVWAAGVTYLRSREARKAESAMAGMYQKVYEAPRPELFFKSLGWRVVADGSPIRIRRDSSWNVPEPELVLVVNAYREIVGYCAGNDVSSRDIEGQNPLYLPQAKIYNGSCALGPGIVLCPPESMVDVVIRLQVQRGADQIFDGETSTSAMKRNLFELVDYLAIELDFPQGVFLMTGTGLVPGGDFTLLEGDLVRVQVGDLAIENPVGS